MRPVSATYRYPRLKANPCGRSRSLRIVTTSVGRPAPRPAGSARTRPRDEIDTTSTPSESTARARAPPTFSAKTSMRKPAGTVISPASATPTLSNASTAQTRHVVMVCTVAPNHRRGQPSRVRCPRAPARLRSSGLPMRRLVLVIQLITLSTASAAAAQEPDEPLARLPPVRVTAPAPVDVLARPTTPSRIDTVAPGDITAPKASALPDVLERLSGVTLQNEQGNRFQPSLTLRGFTASPVTGLPQGLSVFLDGVRLNEPTVDEVNFDLLPLDDVERIEVIRGPSALFGRNTLGGAINIITRRGGEAPEIEPGVEAGSLRPRKYQPRPTRSASHLGHFLARRLPGEGGPA